MHGTRSWHGDGTIGLVGCNDTPRALRLSFTCFALFVSVYELLLYLSLTILPHAFPYQMPMLNKSLSLEIA